jgi:hypothetical protein
MDLCSSDTFSLKLPGRGTFPKKSEFVAQVAIETHSKAAVLSVLTLPNHTCTHLHSLHCFPLCPTFTEDAKKKKRSAGKNEEGRDLPLCNYAKFRSILGFFA